MGVLILYFHQCLSPCCWTTKISRDLLSFFIQITRRSIILISPLTNDFLFMLSSHIFETKPHLSIICMAFNEARYPSRLYSRRTPLANRADGAPVQLLPTCTISTHNKLRSMISRMSLARSQRLLQDIAGCS